MSMDEESVPLSKLHSKKRKRPNLDTEELEIKIDAPEPSSKKALRRARKGKATVAVKLRPTSPSVESESEEEKPSKTAPLKRSEFGIWIGNLPWTATKADVRSFITKNTNMTDEAIIRLHMPSPSDSVAGTSGREKTKPQNRGFAYIDFTTESAFIQALALSEKLLQGRRVLIKDSKSFEGRPEKPKQDPVGIAGTDSGKPPSRRVFVGNLAFDVSKEDLIDHFGHCGAIANVHVATFEDSGVCKGYAWVEFEDLQAGMSAVRGWVPYVKKEESSSEEHEGEGEDEGGEDEDEDEEVEEVEEVENVDAQRKDQAKSVKPAKKPKTKKPPKRRKWWVNKLKGRALRVEFAEDKTVRYKKRYGKDGTARNDHNNSTNDNSSGAAILEEGEELVGGATPEQKTTTTSTAIIPSNSQGDPASPPPPPPTKTNKNPAPLKSKSNNRTATRKTDARNDKIKPFATVSQLAAPRLTGGIVPSQGKKILF